jgi:hypothetical protein
MPLIPLPLVIERYGPPNKMDQFPKGTICIQKNTLNEYEQMSENQEDPVWELKTS